MLQAEKFREIVFIALYSLSFHEMGRDAKDRDALLPSLMKEYAITRSNTQKALDFAEKVLKKTDALDEMIEQASKSFDLTRIQTVERAILRLIFFELFIERHIPVEVAISEGKRLARKFATPDAASFIHALIDAVLEKAD